jgi:hypothetical protein
MKIVLTPAFAVLLLIAFESRASAQAPAPDQPAVGQTEAPPLPPPYAQPQFAPAPLAAPPPPPPDATTLPIQNGGVAPSVTGVVKQYLLTPVGDVEGLELRDGTDVRLPPHMGAALAGIVKPGDRINVVGFVGPQTSYGRAIKALTITNTGTNQSVVDQPPTEPPPPPWMRAASMKTMTVRGTLDRYILNDRGDIDGLILSNGYEVKFPPHIGMAVAMALAPQPSAAIQANGYGTSNAFGTVVDAMTGSLTVGSQSIPIAGPPGPPPPP